MGLAPYGKPKYVKKIRQNLIKFLPNGQFRLNMKYFSFEHSNKMVNEKFCHLFGAPPRASEGMIDQHYKDIAASIQCVCEEFVEALVIQIKKESGLENLVMAGGVALNCVSNGKLKTKGIFKEIWIQLQVETLVQPLGAAHIGRYLYLKRSPRFSTEDKMQCSRLGPGFSDDEILHH